MIKDTYFFDLPIYRINEDVYYKQHNDFIKPLIKQYDNKPSLNSLKLKAIEHLNKKFGGQWEYNEIIGYMKLYFLGSQIRGKYYSVNKKRICKTRTKLIELISTKLSPEVNLGKVQSSYEIYKKVILYIDNCQKELPNRHIYTKKLHLLSEYVDWLKLYENHRNQYKEKVELSNV